jgi:predicted RNA methylase
MTIQLPVNLPNIDAIERGFNSAFESYKLAFEQIERAAECIRVAYAHIEQVTPGASFHHQRDAQEFHKAVKLPSRDVYLRTAHKLLTLRCWHYVIDRCGMQQLMDAQAKREFDAQLRYVPERSKHGREVITDDEASKGPPEFTADNVRATLATFAGDAQMIWRRGIANAFSKLDRRFRSHDGFKVGSRVILTYLADHNGSINRYGNRSEVFRDIERTFHILAGRDPRHARSDFLYQIEEERRGRGFRPAQSEHDSEFFKVRVYKNGNAHLWFTRDDLVEMVNKELAAHYGEVLGDGQTQEPDPLESRAVTHARTFGFFPTPTDLAERIVRQVPFHGGAKRILEPSAGTGNIAYLLAEPRDIYGEKVQHIVDAVEIQPALAAALRATGKLNNVTMADFLRLDPDPKELYDGAVMNPPFDRERDIDHVTHALKFIKPDGFLLAIMSAGTEFRETKKAAAFRKLLDARKGWMIDLPHGSFAEVGTHVNTVLVGIGMRKPHGI